QATIVNRVAQVFAEHNTTWLMTGNLNLPQNATLEQRRTAVLGLIDAQLAPNALAADSPLRFVLEDWRTSVRDRWEQTRREDLNALTAQIAATTVLRNAPMLLALEQQRDRMAAEDALFQGSRDAVINRFTQRRALQRGFDDPALPRIEYEQMRPTHVPG